MNDLPLSFEPVSNGEYLPPRRTRASVLAESMVRRRLEEIRRRTGMSRREILLNGCAMAASLGAINLLSGCRGYAVPPEAEVDPEAARAALGGKEFIFDIQSHHVMPEAPWRRANPWMAGFLRVLPGGSRGEKDPVRGFSRYYFVKEIFLDSDTTCAVLSAVPAEAEAQPLPDPDAAATVQIVDRMAGSRRLAAHALVVPNGERIEEALAGMERVASERRIAAWKVYTPWGPRGRGYWLDDEKIGVPMIEKARALGVKVICAHKGLPLWVKGGAFERPRDIGVVARRFPDVTFIVYHSGFDPAVKEGPYDARAERGIDALIRSLEESGVGRNANVYAELGSTWWMLMKKPAQAAHVLGKLLKHVGEDRVVWGTDSIWYGSPQPQIEAFRAFRIPEELREKHGYPELTAAVKAKIFGLNACRPYGFDPAEIRRAIERDEVEKLKMSYLNDPRPSYALYGPCSRREFFELLARRGGHP
jgi:predicted TIM-barrel fold metal-dependent hydrolase